MLFQHRQKSNQHFWGRTIYQDPLFPHNIRIKCNDNYFHSLINPLIVRKSACFFCSENQQLRVDFGSHTLFQFSCVYQAYPSASILSFSLHDFIHQNSCNDKWYGIQRRKLSFPFRLLVTF